MEKKTIGKFLSALRRAKGMTQKELGEKLFVSDKTISRWERDECTPELSLIPAIAEIFDITTDELLRGERKNPDRAPTHTDDTTQRQPAKSEKQFKVMLYNRLKKHQNLTLISIGISIIGLIAAMLCNLAFSEGFIGFCLACAFVVVSEICQICFAVNARLLLDEDDSYIEQRKEANTKIVQTAMILSAVNIALIAFCLPIVSLIDGVNYGLGIDTWVAYGIPFAVVALALSYVLYTCFLQKVFVQKHLLFLSEAQLEQSQQHSKWLGKTAIIALGIAAILGVGIFVLNIIGIDRLADKEVFYSCDEFKAYVEMQYDTWYDNTYGIEGHTTIIVTPNQTPIYGEHAPTMTWGEIKDSADNVICEYYYNPYLYHSISFTETANDKMPVTILTKQAYYIAANQFADIVGFLYSLIVLDFVICVCAYTMISIAKSRKKK